MLYVQSIQPNFNLQCNFDSLFLDKQFEKFFFSFLFEEKAFSVEIL